MNMKNEEDIDILYMIIYIYIIIRKGLLINQ